MNIYESSSTLRFGASDGPCNEHSEARYDSLFSVAPTVIDRSATSASRLDGLQGAQRMPVRVDMDEIRVAFGSL